MQNSKQAFTAGAISAFNLFPKMPKPQLTQQGWRTDRENLAQDWWYLQ